MKKKIEYIIQDGENKGETTSFEATIPNALPQRLKDKCKNKYKATVTQKNGNQEASINNGMEAITNVTEEVLKYLTTEHVDGIQWIEKDLDDSQITNGDEIVGLYEDDLYGISKKKDED